MPTVNQPLFKKTNVIETNTKKFLLLGDKQGRREHHTVNIPPSLFMKCVRQTRKWFICYFHPCILPLFPTYYLCSFHITNIKFMTDIIFLQLFSDNIFKFLTTAVFISRRVKFCNTLLSFLLSTLIDKT